MPTGYTADVADGKVADFRTFALRCARAFGATVMQRDDPSDDPPKHRKETDYHVKALAGAQAAFVRFSAMTLTEAAEFMAAERAAADVSRSAYRAQTAEQRARYEAMLTAVEAWEPPTADHAEMQKFMREQLTGSIANDCSDFEWPPIQPEQSPAEWLTAKRKKAAEDIRYRADEQAKEIERCATANAWIDALYASLPAPAA